MRKPILLLSIISIITMSTPVTAAQIPTVQRDTYIYDTANVISDDQESTLNQKLLSLELQTSAELFIVTVPGLDGEPLEDFSIRTANTMGIGQKEHNNGLLLLVSPPEGRRNVRIEVGRGMEGIFNDARAGRILDEYFVPYRDQGDYQTAIIKTTETLITQTTENSEWVGKPEQAQLQEALPALIMVPIILLFVFSMIAAGAYQTGKNAAKKSKKDLKFWAILALGFSLINRNNHRNRGPWGNNHGGFFGGGFGGGGFGGGGGGFSGGGSFGGGGASR